MQAALLVCLAAAVRPVQHALLRVGRDGPECECQALPESVHLTNGSGVKAASGTVYPKSYGASCAAHDLETEACEGTYKAAWCHQKWCYVSKDCKAKDTKSSFFFGKDAEVYYSYLNCGGTDAFAAEACAKQSEADCESFSKNCAWNAPSKGCQNKLCQCTGSNGGMDVAKHGFEKGYGETCQEWDEKTCAEYKDDGYELGLWCCKSWCYVDEGCPSAKKSAVGDGLHYSYFACPDDVAALTQCAWQEPIDFGGKAIPLSSKAAEKLNEAHEGKKSASMRVVTFGLSLLVLRV